jgi:hypothetical protein
VRWGPNRRKEARASGSPRGANGGDVSIESGGKGGAKLWSSGTARGGRPRKGGCSWGGRCRAGAKRGEKGLSAFCAEAAHAPGRSEGGSGAVTTRGGEWGGVRHGRGTQRGRGLVE